MASVEKPNGLRDKIASQTEDALGRLAQDLLENPLVSGAISRAFDARERATQAQEVAMGALNIPSAADVERLTRRLRSVSQRLEGIEDSLDRLEEKLAPRPDGSDIDGRLGGVEEQLSELVRLVGELRAGMPGATEPVPRAQERLAVEDVIAAQPASGPAPRKRAVRRPAAAPSGAPDA